MDDQHIFKQKALAYKTEQVSAIVTKCVDTGVDIAKRLNAMFNCVEGNLFYYDGTKGIMRNSLNGRECIIEVPSIVEAPIESYHELAGVLKLLQTLSYYEKLDEQGKAS